MAHFAEIDSNNTVLRVLVIDNSQEHRGQDFLANDCNLGGTWIQTSYNANFRKKFASVGDVYDPIKDVFIPMKPYNSWTFNEELHTWIPPIDYPNDTKSYQWDEENQTWVEIKPKEVTE